MSFLLLIPLLLGFTVVPVMLGARIVGAKDASFHSAFLAAILLAAVSIGVYKFFGNQWLACTVSASAGGLFLARILRTSFWRGIGVSIITVMLQVTVIIVFSDV